ncbi:MAG TPA: thiamine pyrophosphate-dependent dehydrogenase E1 component subunit alpha, partial [Chlamydiales bacterium]
MAQTLLSIDRPQALRTLAVMHWTRFMDDKMNKLVRQNKGGTFHLPVSGHEMIGAVSALSLQSGTDWAYPYYRDRAFAIGIGCKLEDLLAVFLARDVPNHSGGRMMPEHFSDPALRIPCQSSCVGSQFLQAVGTAKAAALRGAPEVVYVSGGDGSTSQGDFHEALNFSCIHNLPIVFVIQDNGWAISVPSSEQTAGGTIAKMAQGYEGLSVFSIDGCDYVATQDALAQAVQKARLGKGPSLVVAKVPRIGAHSSSDDPKKYKNEAMLLKEKEQDPIVRFEAWLLAQKMLTQEELTQLRAKHFQDIEQAADVADAIPFPARSSAAELVFKPYTPLISLPTPPSEESIVLMDALNHALQE